MKDTSINKNRRKFIKNSIAGLAGASIFPAIMKDKVYADEPAKQNFIYRTLGKTGIKLPIVSMGVMNTLNPKLVEAAYNAGIVHFDTAAMYGGMGKSETMLGEFFKDKPRDSFVLSTKIAMPGIMFGNINKNAKPQDFINEFEKSMKRIGLDYVDILYLHGPSNREKTLFEPYLDAIKQMKKEGRTRFIGVSTHQGQPEVIKAAIESKAYDVVLAAYNSTYPNAGEIKKAIAEGAKAGLGIIGMKTVAGVVGGGFGPKKNPTDEEITAAIKWSLEDENVHTIIPGWQTFDHINSTIAVMNNLKMTSAERALLNNRNRQANLFCYQCEECMPQCPADHHIPTLMRSYMYAHGYKNMQMARATLDSMNLKKIACEDCETCTVQCARGFNVKEKILDIARIRDVPTDFLV